MYFHALIPFRPVNPKTRLSGVLSEEEREEFAQVMLGDVISAVRRTGCTATLLCTSKYECRDALVAIRREGLNEAINWALPQFHCPALIIMSDLPMVTPGSLQRVVSTKADMAIVPGLGGGTNILFIKNPEKFHVEYYGFSFRRHLQIAEELGLTYKQVDNWITRYNKRKAAVTAGVPSKRKGRPRTRPLTAVEEYEKEIARLEMENKL
ncbi:MAG TPA: 2-phospho-L-lactate guanylyltransferase, partial [Methanocorpusculum sp.]|nr:2-phospho-L-lactate guanylyltransferase [Methanocorpusculum sp.]